MVKEGTRVVIFGTNFPNLDGTVGRVAYVRDDGDIWVQKRGSRILIRVQAHQVRRRWWPW